MRFLLILAITTALVTKIPKLELLQKLRIRVPEPSDLKILPSGNMLVVSDNGLLCKVDGNGKLISRSSFQGMDFEAVEMLDDTIVVVDETSRLIHFFNQKLEYLTSSQISYSGGRNKGVESITWTGSHWILITEKDPIWIIQTDHDLNQKRRKKWTGCGDVSSARSHKGLLWLLCDEDRELVGLDPTDLSEKHRFKVPVHNPEGFDF